MSLYSGPSLTCVPSLCCLQEFTYFIMFSQVEILFLADPRAAAHVFNHPLDFPPNENTIRQLGQVTGQGKRVALFYFLAHPEVSGLRSVHCARNVTYLPDVFTPQTDASSFFRRNASKTGTFRIYATVADLLCPQRRIVVSLPISCLTVCSQYIICLIVEPCLRSSPNTTASHNILR